MLPVLGQPMVGLVLERLRAAGLRHFVIVGGAGDLELARYCQTQNVRLSASGGSVTHVFQVEPRGTAHALSCAVPHIHGPFVLSACDSFVPSQFIRRMIAFAAETQSDGVLALLRMAAQDLQHSALVEMTDQQRASRIIEKPSLRAVNGDAGSIPLYAFTPRLFDFLGVPVSARGERELQSAIQAMIDAAGDVRGLYAPARQTVTHWRDLLTLNLNLLAHGHGEGVQVQLPEDVIVHSPVRVEKDVVVGPGSVIGPRAYLEAGSSLGAGVSVRDALVLRDGLVPDKTTVCGTVWVRSGQAQERV
jgi:NDP-sugar pyrophosphorylase family protein